MGEVWLGLGRHMVIYRMHGMQRAGGHVPVGAFARNEGLLVGGDVAMKHDALDRDVEVWP